MPAAIQEPYATDEVLTRQDLSLKLKMSLRKIDSLVSSGKLPQPMRFGRAVRWLASEIDAFLKAGSPNLEVWERMKQDKLEAAGA